MPETRRRFTQKGGLTYQFGHAIRARGFSYHEQQIIENSEPPSSELFGSSEEFTDFQREQLQQAGLAVIYLLETSGKQLYTMGTQWFTAQNHDQLAAMVSTTAHHGEIAILTSPFLPNSQGKPLDEQLELLAEFVETLHISGIGGFMGNPIDYIQINEAYKEVAGDDSIDLYANNLPFVRTSTQFGDQEIVGGRVTIFWDFIINSIPAGTAARGVALAPIIAPASNLLQLH